NMSFGGKGSDDGNCGETKPDALHKAICRATAAGISSVVAAANDTEDVQKHVPAAYDEVLTATAIADYDGQPGGLRPPPEYCAAGADDNPAIFSNFATI